MKKEYCRKHGIDYYHYCPECAAERSKREEKIDMRKLELEKKWNEMIEKTVWVTELSNPMLLSVKMFLADQIHKIHRKYDIDSHNCSHFSSDIQQAATESGIRCDFVVMVFENTDIGHAIIAFETDYGLKFFESQSGDEVDVVVGRNYRAIASGFQDESVVKEIHISWNDGTVTKI